MKKRFRPGQSARVTSGEWAGAAGEFETFDTTGEYGRLRIHGIWQGQPIDVRVWFSLTDLEPMA